MKKCLSVFLFVCLVGGLLYAGGSTEEKEVDYLRLSWDELVEQAKKEASLTFAHWRGESFWDDVASSFEDKYAIQVTTAMVGVLHLFLRLVCLHHLHGIHARKTELFGQVLCEL